LKFHAGQEQVALILSIAPNTAPRDRRTLVTAPVSSCLLCSFSPRISPGRNNPGGPGRPKGAKDKLSRQIQECLLTACENVGERIAQRDAEALKAAGREIDLDAPRGLTAFFEWVALEYPQVACAMLARLMPTQQQTEVKAEHRYETFEEVANRLRELGLEPRRIYPLLTDEKKH
jgi:hypothetical protein